VALKLYVEDALKAPLEEFKTPEALKEFVQKQNTEAVLSQTTIDQDSKLLNNGIIALRVNANSGLYDTSDGYREVRISYKYLLSKLLKSDLGIFKRYPDKADIKPKIDELGIKGIILDQLDYFVKDNKVTFTIKKGSTLYVHEQEPKIATFKVELNEKTISLGTLSPLGSFAGYPKKIFQRIMDTNPD